MVHRHRSANVSPAVRQAIIKVYNGLCQYCRKDGANQVDHIVPVAGGGTADLDNLILACERCNLAKSSHDLEEGFVQILRARARKNRDAVERILTKNRIGPFHLISNERSQVSPAEQRANMAARLSQIRRILSPNQASAARAIGVAVNTWNRYERGTRDIDAYVLAEFCRYFSNTPKDAIGLVGWVLLGCRDGLDPELREQLVLCITEGAKAG